MANWTERLNRKYKRTIKMRTSMPTNKSVLLLLASVRWKKPKQHMRGICINRDSGNKRKNNE